MGCEQWREWKQQEQKDAKEGSLETEEWLKANSQICPKCNTHINRSGGCNHMICGSCGQHFCYICGGDWEAHRQQAGGFDYHNCRMGRRSDGHGKSGAKA